GHGAERLQEAPDLDAQIGGLRRDLMDQQQPAVPRRGGVRQFHSASVAAQIGLGAKIASARTVKTISSSMCVSLSTTNPLGIKDEIRQLEGMMLILLEKHQATPRHHRM